MQGQRHPDFARGIVILAAIAAVATCAGCWQKAGSDQSSAAAYRRRLAASGQRLVVADGHGQPVVKLRKRRAKYKVYDAGFTPVGFVDWGGVRPAGGAGRPIVEVRRLGAEEGAIESVSAGSFELDGRLRIEPTDGGWAVFGADAELAGVFEQDARGGWRLRRTYDDQHAVFGAHRAQEDGSWTISRVDSDQPVLAADSDQLAAPEVLAVKLDGLSLLDKMAVGVWIARARPDIAESRSDG